MTPTTEDRVIRLEDGYEHLATKADVAGMKAELKTDIAGMKAELIKWMVGSVAVAASIALFVQKLIE